MCAGLAGLTWAVGAVRSAIHTSLTFRLLYCGPHHIAYFFCDIPPVLRLACADATINELVMLANTGFVVAGCLILIVVSYVFIVAAVLRFRTAQGGAVPSPPAPPTSQGGSCTMSHLSASTCSLTPGRQELGPLLSSTQSSLPCSTLSFTLCGTRRSSGLCKDF